MKKYLCLMLSLMLLACLAQVGLAEAANAQDAICDVWVGEALAVEIWQEDDGAFGCRAVQGDGGDESMVWEFGACSFDAAQMKLSCSDGVRAREVFDDATEELTREVQAEGVTAEFTLGADDRLTWADGEGYIAAEPLVRLDDAESEEVEAGAYIVNVVDQNGDPVPGVFVNFCTDTFCQPQQSDAEGVIRFEGEPADYHLEILKVPEGYSFDAEAEWQTGAQPDGMTLTIRKD